MAAEANQPQGLLASVRGAMGSVLALAQTRFRLLAVELQQEKVRLVDLLLRAALAAILILLALGTLTAGLIYLLWPLSPLAAFGGLTLLYGGVATWLLLGIRRELKHGPQPFAGTLAEFEKDRACFRAGR
jgi:uncharacterized membrane protein YqjE